MAILLGAVIGYERRSPDRPAGLRTMSVTAMGMSTAAVIMATRYLGQPTGCQDQEPLARAVFDIFAGACLFTLSSIYGFDGWNSWDASRVTAAIPSGMVYKGFGAIDSAKYRQQARWLATVLDTPQRMSLKQHSLCCG